MQRLARAAVPHDDGLALVGDADGGDGLAIGVEVRPQLGEGGLDRIPDLEGVVLHPSRLGEVLRKLPVRPPRHRAAFVDGERAHAGGPGVDGDHHGHESVRLGRN